MFKPAITETDPEALAGVLAHEVAHVRRRHVTEALIRELGIGALIRLFAGNVGANAEQIVSLSYTRENEAQADSDAIAMLRRAGHLAAADRGIVRAVVKGAERPAVQRRIPAEPSPRAAGARESSRRASTRTPIIGRRSSRDQADALFDICWKQPVKHA